MGLMEAHAMLTQTLHTNPKPSTQICQPASTAQMLQNVLVLVQIRTPATSVSGRLLRQPTAFSA